MKNLFLAILCVCLLYSSSLPAEGLFFTECCGRQPCSYISWRGDACRPTYDLSADYLFWQNHVDGLEYASVGGLAASADEDIDQGHILDTGCRSKPGFRIGLKVDLCQTCWDAFGQYTFLNYDEVTAAEDPGAIGLSSIRPLLWTFGTEAGETLSLAKGVWRSQINTFDFGMGATIRLDSCFAFRPHLGLKATWQKLKYHVTYQTRPSTTQTTQDDICFTTDFNGLGIRSGMDTEWTICRNLSFVGSFALSAVYSDLNTNRRDEHINNILSSSSPRFKNVHINVEHCTLVPVTELFFALRWEIPMMNGYDYTVMLGWENQMWWNMTQFVLVSGENDPSRYDFGVSGNIAYQGLVARLGVAF